MKSTLGRRASICKELGFSLDFVEHGISYAKLQMMVVDMPRIVHIDKDNITEALTDENADDIIGMLMSKGGVLKE